MKTFALFLLFCFLVSGIYPANKPTGNFVIIYGNTYYCDDIHVGKSSTKIFYEGKKFIKIPTSKISAYAEGGSLFEYLPVINKNQDTTGWAFMQYIACSNGNRLYRYCSNCLKYDPVTGIIAPLNPIYRYYIFKNGSFVSVTDDQDMKEQLAVFGLKLSQ